MERKIKFDDRRFIKLWHLFYYFPRKSSWDNNAQLILDFKTNSKPATEYLLECALRELRAYHLKEEIIVIRALKSTELKPGDGKVIALDMLGQGIATGIKGIYIPQLLCKKRLTKPLKDFDASGREREIAGVYEVRDIGLSLDNRQIILIDDVVTTGVTSRAIARVILIRYPLAKINVFALAWTPSKNQRNMLYLEHTAGLELNEPVLQYGKYPRKLDDEDYDRGETYIRF
jgi:hypothetical protein